jgi:hypothetical protein
MAVTSPASERVICPFSCSTRATRAASSAGVVVAATITNRTAPPKTAVKNRFNRMTQPSVQYAAIFAIVLEHNAILVA